MIYGRPRLVANPADKVAGLRCITEHVAPGQCDYARQPSRKELAAVRLLALPLDKASVKIRTGPPDDADTPDAALDRWAGELPLGVTWQQPSPIRPSRRVFRSLPTSAPAPEPRGPRQACRPQVWQAHDAHDVAWRLTEEDHGPDMRIGSKFHVAELARAVAERCWAMRSHLGAAIQRI